MATLDSYIAELTNFQNNLEKIINVIVLNKQNEVVDIVKARLIGSGKDAKLKLIGGGIYKPFTISDKKASGSGTGKITSHFTLFHDGGFHRGMFVQESGDFLFISSTDAKTNLLIGEYGEDILGLTEPETKFVTDQIIDPELQKIINKLPQTIDI